MAKTFSANKEKVQDSIRKPQLKYPYLGLLKFTGVSFDKRESGSGENKKEWQNLELTFECMEDYVFPLRDFAVTKKGTEYTHSPFSPKETASEEKQEESFATTVNHIWYILSYFCGENNADKLTNIEWKEGETINDLFNRWCSQINEGIHTLVDGDFSKFASNPILAKIPGNVYDKKRKDGKIGSGGQGSSLRWPDFYAGYLAQPGQETIDWEKGDLEKCSQYIDFLASGSAAAAPSSTPAGSSVETKVGNLGF